MNRIVGIYKITSPSNNIYIGQSVNIEKRFKRYKSLDCVKQIKLYRSFLKHGIENHKFEIVKECNEDKLNILEREYQEFYNSVNFGLNCLFTKTNDKSGSCSEETRIRIKNGMIGRKITWGDKISKSKKGNTIVSEITKNKISLSLTGRKQSKETKLKRAKKITGSNNGMHGILGHKNHFAKKVSQYSLSGEFIKVYDCIKYAIEETGAKNIGECANGNRKTAKGYIWKWD